MMIAVAAALAISAAPQPRLRAEDAFNYVIGTQTFAPGYRFTRETSLVETARAILDMGSNVLKISMEKGYSSKQYPGVPDSPAIKTLAQLARDEPSYRAVLDMPFAHILLWTYPFDVGWWDDGLSQAEADATYRQMYDLTAHLLRTYGGTGKTFYLGHWEGDWHLHRNYDPGTDPTPTAVLGMTDWLNVRQRAIDDASRKVRHRDVRVCGYVEVNLVQKAMKGGASVTNSVLPNTSVDYVSYSSYDSLSSEASQIPDRLTRALDYIESKLPPKPGIKGKRVFIGEYGFPARAYTPDKQDELTRAVCRTAIEWGCPFALYWEMYCNEVKDGKHNGFWMIDDKGRKQPVYDTHARFYTTARARVAEFRRSKRRLPTRQEYAKLVMDLLK